MIVGNELSFFFHFYHSRLETLEDAGLTGKTDFNFKFTLAIAFLSTFSTEHFDMKNTKNNS